MRNELNELNEVDIEEMLDSALNDSTNALSAIGQASEIGTKILRERPDLWAQRIKLQNLFNIIEKQKDFAFRILSDLKNWIATEEIKPAEFQFTFIEPLINDVLQMVIIPEEIKEIKITAEVPENFQLMIDPFSMKRLLINLINNATQAILRSGRIKIKAYEKNGKVCIEVQDTGVGMSKEILGKLFTKRFTTKARGTGFGLFICESIVKAHSGFIFAKSQEKEGTTFTVVLPKI